MLKSLVLLFVIVFVIAFIFKRCKKEIVKCFSDKQFLAESLIQILLFSTLVFFINLLIFEPLFSPQISIDSTCNYQSPLGQYNIKLENKGDVGEEGFTIIFEDIILTNFSYYPLSRVDSSVIHIVNRENLLAYTFSERWSKEYCLVEYSHPVIEKDTRGEIGNKPLPKVLGEHLKIHCKYFPPKSKTILSLNSLRLDKNLAYEYFGENTEVTKGVIMCKPPICMSPLKDFILDTHFELTNQRQFRYCTGDFSKYFGKD